MLSAILRKPVSRVVDPVAVFLLRLGITPNGMTFFGSLGTSAMALWLWPQGEYFWGTMGVIAFIFSDLLDGTMARISKKSSQGGAFFDSTIDRVVDVALIGALLLSLLKTDDRLAVVAFTALIGGFLLLHFYEQIFGSHEPAESDYGHDHEHSHNFTGAFGAIAMGGHVFLDGLALGVAFTVDSKLGVAVFIALLVHFFF